MFAYVYWTWATDQISLSFLIDNCGKTSSMLHVIACRQVLHGLFRTAPVFGGSAAPTMSVLNMSNYKKSKQNTHPQTH